MQRREIDADAVKERHPIEGVVARYGLSLKRSGRSLIGRCPFHDDRGKPNLVVWPEIHAYKCYRCDARGDTIRLVMELERCGFREAVEWLEGGLLGVAPAPQPRPRQRDPIPADYATLEAAVEQYSMRLMDTPRVLEYLRGRGVDRTTASRLKVGYVEGDDLLWYLKFRRMRPESAELLRLLKKRGDGTYREHFGGRIVIPDFKGDRARWMIGRAFDVDHRDRTPAWRGGAPVCNHAEEGHSCPPKYLCLAGAKPLMGIEQVEGLSEVWVVEGPFDRIPLLRWRFPAVALIGTGAKPETIEALSRFERVHLMLDADEAGREAAAKLAAAVGHRARVHSLPSGFKDLGELAGLPDGHEQFITHVAAPSAR
ncbi:MAG: CHC2 zinc finger domain-containing protein [Chloroflexota bacterium]|nr:CHC2 zinc finger domain-containing protein [Chloroflexota bacterium]